MFTDYENDENIFQLKSVGSVFNDWTQMVYPSLLDGGYDEEMGVHISEVDDDWFDALDDQDKSLLTSKT
jgi:hypothetical protein